MTALPSISWTTLTIDCSDADELGAFYSRLLGWEITARDGVGWLQLRDPRGGIGLNIQAESTYEAPVWPVCSSTASREQGPAPQDPAGGVADPDGNELVSIGGT